jgi:hypothetical protein
MAHIPVPVPTSNTFCLHFLASYTYIFRRLENYLWIRAYWCQEELSIKEQRQHVMATNPLGIFNTRKEWCGPNIQLLVHSLIIWSPDSAFSSDSVTCSTSLAYQ